MLTVRPTSLAARTAARICPRVSALRSVLRLSCTPLSPPIRMAQQPASFMAWSSGRSTMLTQAEANQAKSSRRARMAWQSCMARS
ncbi:MAG: hypothetical protein A3G97_05660 [Candidatus Rokubacteria bacterium RIFCSPLOWO2_12_FULL_69_21]|nr:MAG: hypothetical protein A3G97_05660 [Candidatus Rokubacteria bacterium RIFCSPLOWO2_12_FULL_69_21]